MPNVSVGFEVNETLLDLKPLDIHFERIALMLQSVFRRHRDCKLRRFSLRSKWQREQRVARS